MTQTIESMTVHQFRGIAGTATIRPNGPGCIVLAGDNGQGKTSYLKGIEEIFIPGGIKGTPNPLHNGTDEAYIEVVTDKATLRKTFREGKPVKFEALAPDGTKLDVTPVQWVAQATGGLVVNTETFIGKSDKEQRAELLKRVSLPFDLDKKEAERAAVYAERTKVNADVERLKGQLAGAAAERTDLPTEEQSAGELAAQLAGVTTHNAQQMPLYNAAIAAGEQATAHASAISMARERLAALEAQRPEVDQAAQAALDAYNAFTLLDAAAYEAQLANISEINAAIRGQQERARIVVELDAKKSKAEGMTAALERIEKEKRDALAAADFPIEGLSVDETGITFNGQPFKTQVNSGRQREIAIDLATSGDQDVRLVFIQDGDMLDDASLARINELCAKRNFYALVERGRDNSGQIGVVFTEGGIA